MDQLANRMAVQPTSYSRMERGERRCYLDKAQVLAKILGCTVEELAIEPTSEERLEKRRAA